MIHIIRFSVHSHIIHENPAFVQSKEVFMQEFTIHLRSVRDINDFVALTAPLCAITLTDGLRVVDGKSFMEIFCLQLSGPITVAADCPAEDFERFRQDCLRFQSAS